MPDRLITALEHFETLAYLLAALLFILALAQLSRQKTALQGNRLGVIGMTLALAAVIIVAVLQDTTAMGLTIVLMVLALVIGGAYGIWKANRVQMTEMPQLVAMLH